MLLLHLGETVSHTSFTCSSIASKTTNTLKLKHEILGIKNNTRAKDRDVRRPAAWPRRTWPRLTLPRGKRGQPRLGLAKVTRVSGVPQSSRKQQPKPRPSTGSLCPKGAQVSRATDFPCTAALDAGPAAPRGCVAWPPQQQGRLEISTESCAWSGCHRESAAAPRLQTAPPGYREETKSSEAAAPECPPPSSFAPANLGAPPAHLPAYP